MQGFNPAYLLEGLMLKPELQYSGHLMQRADSLEKTWCWESEGKRRKGWQMMRWLDSIIYSVDMNLSKLWEIVKDREAWHATVHGVTKSQTRLINSTTTIFRSVKTEESVLCRDSYLWGFHPTLRKQNRGSQKEECFDHLPGSTFTLITCSIPTSSKTRYKPSINHQISERAPTLATSFRELEFTTGINEGIALYISEAHLLNVVIL